MDTIAFETFPKSFSQLSQEINEIKRLLMEQNSENQSDSDAWFNLNEFCNYPPDKRTKQTVYGWVNAGLLPVHKDGKRLRFLKSEIDK